jgi:hypothetical protein
MESSFFQAHGITCFAVLTVSALSCDINSPKTLSSHSFPKTQPYYQPAVFPQSILASRHCHSSALKQKIYAADQ